MRTIRTKVYQFSELSNEAKQRAIKTFEDINVNFDWWEPIYEDAKQVGLLLNDFNMDSAVRDVQGEFASTAEKTATLILETHCNHCETYKTAHYFLSDLKKSLALITNDTEGDTDSIEDLERIFLGDLLIDYKNLLQSEFDTQCSDEAIIETIEAREYEFTKDGIKFNR